MDSRTILHMPAPDSTGCDSLPMLESLQTWIVKDHRVGCLTSWHLLFPLCMAPLYHIHQKCQIHVKS